MPMIISIVSIPRAGTAPTFDTPALSITSARVEQVLQVTHTPFERYRLGLEEAVIRCHASRACSAAGVASESLVGL